MTPNNVSEALKRYAVNVWDLPLEHIDAAENSRQTTESGVKVIEDSIKKKGLMATSMIQVMFPDLKEGEEMTQDKANTLRAILLGWEPQV